MENKGDDEIRKRWELEKKEKKIQEERVIARPRKRLREIEYTVNSTTSRSNTIGDDEENLGEYIATAIGSVNTTGKARAKKTPGTRTTRGASTRARGKVLELGDEDFVDLE